MKNCLLWSLVILASVAAAGSQGGEQPPKAGGDGANPPKEIAVDLGGGVKMKMVLIPAGEFAIGRHKSAEDDGRGFPQNLRRGSSRSGALGSRIVPRASSLC